MGSTPSGPRPAGTTDIETTSPWDQRRVVALPRSPPDTLGFEGEGHRRSSPPDVRQTPAPWPDASRTIVGTGAGLDLLPVDEALDLADDVGAARIIFHTASIIVCMSGIIVGTDGIIIRIPVMIVGMGRIIVSAALIIVGTDRYVVGTRGNEVSGRGNEVSARGTEPGRERDP
jgi:hypothetical protein